VRAVIILLLFTFSFFLFPLPANASYISLQTALSSRYEHGRLTVNVSALNKGDEPAYNVQWEFRAGGRSVLGDKIPVLDVGSTMRTVKRLPFPAGLPGNYPLTLITHYADANQYPFSALTLQTFTNGQDGYPTVAGRLSSAAFDREGRLTYRLKNGGPGLIVAVTRLVAPAELTVAPAERVSTIEPGSEQVLSFTVKNFSALFGSTYQAFAVTEFDRDGRHYTVIAPGLAKIIERQELLGIDYSVYIGLLAGLLLLFVAAQFFKKK
jgi:hypothetical protein